MPAKSLPRLLHMAVAAEIYAKRQQLGEEAIGYAHAIRIEALRRLGELLQATERAVGGEYGGKARIDGSRQEPSNPTQTLSDLGLDKKTSSVAQKLADLPQEQFEAVREGATMPETMPASTPNRPHSNYRHPKRQKETPRKALTSHGVQS